jgi:hypothetical protein
MIFPVLLVKAVAFAEEFVDWRQVGHGAESATGARKPLSRPVHPSPAPNRPFLSSFPAIPRYLRRAGKGHGVSAASASAGVIGSGRA